MFKKVKIFKKSHIVMLYLLKLSITKIDFCFFTSNYHKFEGRVASVSALVSRSSSTGLSPHWGHCILHLEKTLYSHSASLYPGV